MNSALYECTVMHRRLHPSEHRFVYRIFLFWLDLDELDAVARRIPFFGVNRPNLYSYRDDDHFPGRAGSTKDRLIEFLRGRGEMRTPSTVRLLALPRLLGYTFNPISVYVCFDENSQPFTCVIEVENTFHERKGFVVPPCSPDAFASRETKHFYVSPFSDMDLAFDFRVALPGDRLDVAIDDYRGDQCVLVSKLVGRRRALTARSLAAMTVKYPLVTVKIIAAIHWQAFRLWLKKVPFFKKEDRRDLQRDVLNPHKSIR